MHHEYPGSPSKISVKLKLQETSGNRTSTRQIEKSVNRPIQNTYYLPLKYHFLKFFDAGANLTSFWLISFWKRKHLSAKLCINKFKNFIFCNYKLNMINKLTKKI